MCCSCDYKWLHKELVKNGNDVTFDEYELGHMGLIFAKDKTCINKLLD